MSRDYDSFPSVKIWVDAFGITRRESKQEWQDVKQPIKVNESLFDNERFNLAFKDLQDAFSQQQSSLLNH